MTSMQNIKNTVGQHHRPGQCGHALPEFFFGGDFIFEHKQTPLIDINDQHENR
jgi:hypothetical protein